MSDHHNEDMDEDVSSYSIGDVQSSAVTSNYKVLGQLEAPDGTGVLGYNTATSGISRGVEGRIDSLDPQAAAVRGEVSPGGLGAGVRGYNLDDPTAALAWSGSVGVYGQTDDIQGVGIIGLNSAKSGQPVGVQGSVPNTLDGYGLSTPDNARIKGAIDTDATVFKVNAGTTSTADAQNVVMGHTSNAASTLAGDATGATISGGGYDDGTDTWPNEVFDNYGTVGGGRNNTAGSTDTDATTAEFATVGGGEDNTASASYATVGGGFDNTASVDAATVGGGVANTASGPQATVGGGFNNTASGSQATVGGGEANTVTSGATYGTISGGTSNAVTTIQATVGGGEQNTASGTESTVGGGALNTASVLHATVGGGLDNTASGWRATVGGGYSNSASGTESTVAGGRDNTASAVATVGGGSYNTASAKGATVAGGNSNTASGKSATVPGGNSNTASGKLATVPGGGDGKAADVSSFVWNDGNHYHDIDGDGTAEGFSSSKRVSSSTDEPTGDQTFNVSAQGGVRFVTGSSSVTYIPAGTVGWSTASSRAVKTNIDPIDPMQILDGVMNMEVAIWEYTDDNSDGQAVRQVGPMAGDFHEVVDVGTSDDHINSVNADGVAFAAIQGLAERVEQKDRRIEKLEAINEQLRERLETETAKLRSRLADLEAQVGADPTPADN